MSKSELINSASEYEIMELKKVKLQMVNTCLNCQSFNHTCANPVF